MIGRSFTFSRIGMFCNPIDVEVDIKRGLPKILITGLLSQEVKESKERIRPAITNSGFDFPSKRVTINLAPAETIKTGTHFDLAIASAILKASGYIDEYSIKTAYFGELSLSGEIKWVRGILPMILQAFNAGFERIFIPSENYHEIEFLNNKRIIPVKNLNEIVDNKYETNKKEHLNNNIIEENNINNLDYSDIMGQSNIVKACKIAAAGNHHMLIVGPPGSGKTMSASRISTIMPYLMKDEIIEINKIYSIAANDFNKKVINHRPFRTPHNSSSSRAIIGGGPKVLPGEISLAHKGILFLDEFLEFRSDTLQALRTVIEKKEVYISLRNGCAIYPADFLLVAAANPCSCGFYATKEGFCTCSISEIKKYRKKLRNPLVDRIDIQVKAERINYKDLTNGKKNESSEQIRSNVLSAIDIQKERYSNEDFSFNSQIPAEKIHEYCKINNKANEVLENFIEENLLTARACHKILGLSRTIGDLKGEKEIMIEDIYEAINYRFLDVEPV